MTSVTWGDLAARGRTVLEQIEADLKPSFPRLQSGVGIRPTESFPLSVSLSLTAHGPISHFDEDVNVFASVNKRPEGYAFDSGITVGTWVWGTGPQSVAEAGTAEDDLLAWASSCLDEALAYFQDHDSQVRELLQACLVRGPRLGEVGWPEGTAGAVELVAAALGDRTLQPREDGALSPFDQAMAPELAAHDPRELIMFLASLAALSFRAHSDPLIEDQSALYRAWVRDRSPLTPEEFTPEDFQRVSSPW